MKKTDLNEKEYTDLTFELFNYCNGSCPGCMLNLKEHQFFDLASEVEDIFLGLTKLAEYGKKNNIRYRPVFSFGDVPKLDWIKQEKIYLKAKELGLNFGITLTCVDASFDYKTIIDKIVNISSDLVFDITIDPFRLNNPIYADKYIENLRYAVQKAPHLHLQTLLSNTMMKQFSPEELLTIFSKIGTHPVFMGFSPTIENMSSKDRYNYTIKNAFEYAKRFYSANELQKDFFKQEISRFENSGSYEDFLKQTFHIDSNLNVYPVSYSIYGDIIQDKRNESKVLGNLHSSSLDEILNPKSLKKINIINNMQMEDNTFDCINCEFINACTFQGIGIIRKTYSDYEFRAGHCYGPIHLNYASN